MEVWALSIPVYFNPKVRLVSPWKVRGMECLHCACHCLDPTPPLPSHSNLLQYFLKSILGSLRSNKRNNLSEMVFVPHPPLPPRLIMRLSHHILYCDIFVKYPLQEFSVLPSINLPGWSLRCRMPRALISRWNLGSPYNWLRQLDKNNHHHQHPEVLVHILAVLSLIADTWMVLWWNFLYRTRVHYNVTRLQQLCIRHRILLTFNVFAIILTCKFMQYLK